MPEKNAELPEKKKKRKRGRPRKGEQQEGEPKKPVKMLLKLGGSKVGTESSAEGNNF